MKKSIIAIDGPAGAGKSTIARLVARKLGYLYIDTGAMYRTIAWKIAGKKIDFKDEKSVVSETRRSEITLEARDNGELNVYLDGKEVTKEIRTEKIGRAANAVASIGGVRKILVQRQRQMGRKGGVVMEGRDIGTKVFPNAQFKFYLDASPRERAKRRYQELKSKGKNVTLKEISRAVEKRDSLDQKRKVSPLMKADDAFWIDSTHLNSKQVAEKIIRRVLAA